MLIAFIAAALSVSCRGDRYAQAYAAQLAHTLSDYQARVDAKLAAEQQSYLELAKSYDQAEQSRLIDSLDRSRNAAARALSDRVQEAGQSASGRKFVWQSELTGALREFAEADFRTEERLLGAEADRYQSTLGDLDDLEQEKDKVKKLQTALEHLSHPKTSSEQLKAGAQFGCELNAKYRALDIDTRSSALDAQIASAKDDSSKADLRKQKLSLAEEKAAVEKSCDEK